MLLWLFLGSILLPFAQVWLSLDLLVLPVPPQSTWFLPCLLFRNLLLLTVSTLIHILVVYSTSKTGTQHSDGIPSQIVRATDNNFCIDEVEEEILQPFSFQESEQRLLLPPRKEEQMSGEYSSHGRSTEGSASSWFPGRTCPRPQQEFDLSTTILPDTVPHVSDPQKSLDIPMYAWDVDITGPSRSLQRVRRGTAGIIQWQDARQKRQEGPGMTISRTGNSGPITVICYSHRNHSYTLKRIKIVGDARFWPVKEPERIKKRIWRLLPLHPAVYHFLKKQQWLYLLQSAEQ
jgi:hypothetical protein